MTDLSKYKRSNLRVTNIIFHQIDKNILQFGRPAVILLGNFLQLDPVLGIFEEPKDPSWKAGSTIFDLFSLFQAIKLRYNHRQEGEAAFAEPQKRAARRQLTDEDVELLKPRVVP